MELYNSLTDEQKKEIKNHIIENLYVTCQYYRYCRNCETLVTILDNSDSIYFTCLECNKFQCIGCFPKWWDFGENEYNPWPYMERFTCMLCVKQTVNRVRYTHFLPSEIWDVIYDHVFSKSDIDDISM